jgi:hypothetical protein
MDQEDQEVSPEKLQKPKWNLVEGQVVEYGLEDVKVVGLAPVSRWEA